MRFLACLELLVVTCTVTLAPVVARAQSPTGGVVVVDVPAGERGLEATRLRADVGAELGVEAVAPDDPRASQASGTVRVSVDHTAHALVVEYHGRGEPITRTVDLPADPDATERAAVLLAGNLARDEAGDLAATLRTPKPAPPPPSPPSVEDLVPEDVELGELTHLGTTLDFDARGSRLRKTFSDVTLGVGLGALLAAGGFGVYGLTSGAHWAGDVDFYLLQTAEASLVWSYVLRPGNFGELSALYARERAEGLPPALVVDDVERAWFRAARHERHNRRLAGWVGVIGGSFFAVASGLALSAYRRQPGAGSLGAWSGLGGIGTVDIVAGIVLLASDGPLESALKRYETATGRLLEPTESARLLPVVAPVPGGGIVGLGGRF